MKGIKNWLSEALKVFGVEMKGILHDAGVMIIFVVAGFLYPVLYNYVYKNGVLEDTPIAVVDDSGSADSRRLTREMDATRECRVEYVCADMNEARRLFKQRKVNGIVYFPSDFADNIARRQTARLSVYADMSSFLYYKNLLMSSEFVMLHEINSLQIERYSEAGMTEQETAQAVNVIPYEENLPYNRTFSYSIFLLSAVLMLIIQQVMFYGMSMNAGTMREQNRSFASLPDSMLEKGVGHIVFGRSLAYWLLFMIIGLYVAFIVPAMFRFPQRGRFWDIAFLVAFYDMVCVFFCMTWSSFITRRESAFLLFLFMSPVCLFLTGFSWPATAFPAFWKYFSYLFPSTFGCQAFINMNTAGATLHMNARLLWPLAIQGMAYFTTSCIAIYLENFVWKHKSAFDAERKRVQDSILEEEGL